MSITVPSRHTRTGTWVNSNFYTSILYNLINFHARVLYKHTEYTGSLGYKSVCYMTSRIRWVFKEKSEQMYPVMGGKRLGGIKGCKVFKEKSERYITSRNGWVSQRDFQVVYIM